jgi:hypothetical protein
VVRSARLLTDKVQDIFGSIFTRTELSEVLTEIVKMDPKFDKEQFLKDCEADFIPNILEAISRNVGDCRKIKLTEDNAKFLRLKSNVLKRTLRQLFICLRPSLEGNAKSLRRKSNLQEYVLCYS